MITVTPVAALYLYLDWRAEKRWSESVAMLKREGETLSLMDLMPPRLPESENFAALPELRGINIIEEGDDKKGASGAKRQALLDLMSGLEKITPRMYQGITLGRSPDWSEIMAELKTASFITDLPPMGKETEAFKFAIETRNPLLKVLSEASSSYQDAEWVPAMRDQILPKHLAALHVPHYNAIKMTCQALNLHAIAAAESGKASAALDDYRTISLLSKALVREPLMTGHLLSLLNNRNGLEIVWCLLKQRRLQESGLADLHAVLSTFRPEQSFQLGLRGELITGVNNLDALATDPDGNGLYALAGMNVKNGDIRSWIGRAVPDSFFTESRAAFVELHMDHFMLPMKRGGTWDVVRQKDTLFEALGRGGLYDPPFERFLARLFLPLFITAAERTLHVEAMRQQAIVACALERFLIANGRYPEHLDELVPQFLASVPLDPVDQLPLRYRQGDSGRYRIWCVGMDGVDNDGQVNLGPGDNPESILSKPHYQGDWTWQYDPVPHLPTPSRLSPPLGGLPQGDWTWQYDPAPQLQIPSGLSPPLGGLPPPSEPLGN
ncbi:hypothetical protein WJU23_19430 [Prosthecobacter sp. SYSU 5D2]|uniref:hypothetical protein n=1 Tax=Prosthecobacter sp. SYSU 5D2 TaxID=3134134 RepID=UPI0031FE5644